MATGILFDLDGVIVDSRTAIVNSLNAALAAHGRAERDASELAGYIGWTAHKIMRDLLGSEASEEEIDSAVNAFRGRLGNEGEDETTLFDGMDRVLAELAGRAPLVVATTKPVELAEPLLEARGIRQHFLAVFGSRLGEVAPPKAETVRAALDALPDPSQAVMVGDRKFDVEAAASHGTPCIGVLWGFGDEAELREAGAAEVLAAPDELLSSALLR